MYIPTTNSREDTVRAIESIINERLRPEWRRVFVHFSKSSMSFTLFPVGWGDYRIRFVNLTNLRNWRPDGDPEVELEILLRWLRRVDVLQDVIII
jgi:hypothetical protein